ncbi:petrobactin biosynthesis protein AsbD [Bacillus suaedaesalsae]|uniref:Petrobactin biosynthesis protein AsbD n=1 Tax=Bacillus suaedaesalsae TaxID=2810349 RepID=A0ABS2DKA9_9BACI|nr:petrobactin biosynthesis protein AsbD [Bacillus suaedaesalsae]MBM6618936.1 petrobactin biosynthesis protein AsbD [Bacillus suaedaesalsae]
MNRQEINDVIYEILQTELNIETLSLYSEQARLNQDLYLDSVMILQLILLLELKLGVTIPDHTLNPKDFETVASLIDFIKDRRSLVDGGVA